MHSTTTLQRIIRLYDEERQLLDRTGEDWLSAAERARFADIRAGLERLWRDRRQELVFSLAGPPRLLGGGSETDQKRQIAHGIAPLPSGGVYGD